MNFHGFILAQKLMFFQSLHRSILNYVYDDGCIGIIMNRWFVSIAGSSDSLKCLRNINGRITEQFGFKSKGSKVTKDVPFQSYLIAIAAGKLESRKIGPRSHVWSEKELVDKVMNVSRLFTSK